MRLTGYLVKSTIVAAFGGLLFGFDTAVIAGTTGDLSAAYHLSAGTLGFTVASALYGTIIGAMLAAIPGDRYGRPRQPSVHGGPISRFRPGMRVRLGLVFAYLFSLHQQPRHRRIVCAGAHVSAEIAPARWRGRLVGFFQFNIVFGILLAYRRTTSLG